MKGAFAYISKAVDVLKEEGFIVFWRKAKLRIKLIFLQNKRIVGYFMERLYAEKGARDMYDVIFFSVINWEYRYQRPQHIASAFARKGHRVFYLNIKLEKGHKCKCVKISDNIYEVVLPFVQNTFIYDIDFSKGLNVVLVAIENFFKRFVIKEAVALVEFPLWAPIVDFLKEKFGVKVIFDCLDEYSGFDNISAGIHDAEMKLLRISDHCTTTSDMLYVKHKEVCDNVSLIRNGTEFQHFNSCSVNLLLQDIKKPIIGYYGAISYWFDVEIIRHLALTRPHWSIVLIGCVYGDDTKVLSEYANVHFLGEQPYAKLPGYLYWFDVCIIPFKIVPLTLSTNPVKFYEFISAGKPVVSVELPELSLYKDNLYFAKNKEDFVEKIDKALLEDSDKLRNSRISLARQNDWEQRFQEISNIVKGFYPLVSIIIVTYNNLQYSKLCLASIYTRTAYPNFELIIVDNASSDGTVEYLQEMVKQHSNIKLICNEDNKGFAGGNNIGMAAAQGEFIILLNNDTIVTCGWISGLLKYLNDSNIGMVGPVTNWAANEARIDVDYFSPKGIEKFAERYSQKHRNKCFDIPVLAMYCVALRKSTVEKIGLLDERFTVGMFEDDDYAYRIKLSGLRVVCVEDVFIHHFGRVSFSKIEQERYKRIFDENRQKFEQKWMLKWVPHGTRKIL